MRLEIIMKSGNRVIAENAVKCSVQPDGAVCTVTRGAGKELIINFREVECIMPEGAAEYITADKGTTKKK